MAHGYEGTVGGKNPGMNTLEEREKVKSNWEPWGSRWVQIAAKRGWFFEGPRHAAQDFKISGETRDESVCGLHRLDRNERRNPNERGYQPRKLWGKLEKRDSCYWRVVLGGPFAVASQDKPRAYLANRCLFFGKGPLPEASLRMRGDERAKLSIASSGPYILANIDLQLGSDRQREAPQSGADDGTPGGFFEKRHSLMS